MLYDTNKFIPQNVEGSDKKTWYCLQPIIIKKCDEETKKTNGLTGTWYEVIDGQQRLTTMSLIIRYANEMWRGKEQHPNFTIKYATRNESSEFLQALEIDTPKNTNDNNNIDFFYMHSAYNVIDDWAKKLKKANWDEGNFQSTFLHHCEVIWYEVSSEEDSVEIFTRINMGKIPLTNAELIKALFLNKSNFGRDNEKTRIQQKQLEIASEWDRMEYTLQDEEFWYFLNETSNPLATRLEFVLNLQRDVEVNRKKKNEDDPYAIYKFFSEKLAERTKETIEENWGKVKRLFQTLEEWYNNRELYHKIGFLITTGTTIKALVNQSEKRKKSDFKDYITAEIAKKIQDKNLEDLEYSNSKDRYEIKKILLLHNIQTMLKNNNSSFRFPFALYKNEDWSLEHIHARNPQNIEKNKLFKEWYEPIDKKLLPRELSEKADEILGTNKDDSKAISQLVAKITQHFGNTEDDSDGIGNLALLSKSDNSRLQNGIFPVKRKKIIELDNNGYFIPICTKKVFQKYYNGCTSKLYKWEGEDQEAYLTDIEHTLKYYK